MGPARLSHPLIGLPLSGYARIYLHGCRCSVSLFRVHELDETLFTEPNGCSPVLVAYSFMT